MTFAETAIANSTSLDDADARCLRARRYRGLSRE